MKQPDLDDDDSESGHHNGRERIALLEREQRSMRRDMSAFAKSVESGFRDVTAQLTGLSREFAQSRKTPWGVLSGWASVIMIVVGFFAQGPLRDIDRTEKEAKETAQRFFEYAVESAKRNAEQDAKLEARKEIQEALRDAVDQRLRALETRLSGK